MMPHPTNTTVKMWKLAGVVLCGGESRRMGQPKAWLPFGRETILSRIVATVSQVVELVAVVRRPGQALPPLVEPVRIVEDIFVGLGPLAGLHAGIFAVRNDASHVLVVSCDVPLVKVAFLRRLAQCMEETFRLASNSTVVPLACVPVADDQRHPLVAIYSVEVLSLLETLLHQGRLRPAFLLEQIPVRWLSPNEWADIDPESVSLTNINTPQEYRAAWQRAGFGDPP